MLLRTLLGWATAKLVQPKTPKVALLSSSVGHPSVTTQSSTCPHSRTGGKRSGNSRNSSPASGLEVSGSICTTRMQSHSSRKFDEGSWRETLRDKYGISHPLEGTS